VGKAGKALVPLRIEEGQQLLSQEDKGGGLVVCQCWQESEAGWGVRPDGYSIHLDMADQKKFVADFWREQHEFFVEWGLREGEVPDEYTRPSGDPYMAFVSLGDMFALRRARAKNIFGVRTHVGQPPRRAMGFVASWLDDD
jgi:hypothetical protein